MASDQTRDLAEEIKIRQRAAAAIEKLEHYLHERRRTQPGADDGEGKADSCVGARLKPQPTLNSGAIALPLPEEPETVEDIAPSPREMQLSASL